MEKNAHEQAALRYAEAGLYVLPVWPDSRKPRLGRNWQQQVSRDELTIRRWWKDWPDSWVGIATGHDGLVVIDLDVKDGKNGPLVWSDWIGSLGVGRINQFTRVAQTPSGGRHIYFRLPEGQECGNRVEVRPGIDVRGTNGYVLAPPSGGSTWLQKKPIAEIPGGVLAEILGGGESGRRGARSGLAGLLASPPPKGGRNDWLAHVAGHLVRGVRFEDGLVILLERLNQMLPEPLSPEEAAEELPKMAASLIRKEDAKEPVEQAEWSKESGWIAGDGTQLWTKVKTEEGWELEPWANFDMSVVGIVQEDDRRFWLVDVSNERGTIRDTIEPKDLSRTESLATWLGNHGGVTILPPSSDKRNGPEGRRLMRYLESQEAPRMQAVPWMGDNDENGWVTFEGRITAAGLEQANVIPHSTVPTGSFAYGFGALDDGLHILRETLTFHDETVCAVFGAWWAACILKGHFMRAGAALFPFVALEGTSETGKTQGFFADMIRLSGYTGRQADGTQASLRNRIAAHRNGIVWIDDKEFPQDIFGLLRQATAEGAREKMGEDRTHVVNMRLVAPIVVSGEALGAITTEKALIDRCVRLELSSPKNRKSRSDALRPQWDDRLDLVAQFPDYTAYAGTLVAEVLRRASFVDQFRELRQGAGRHGDKMAILRVGALVLADMLGDRSIVQRVNAWCTLQDDLGSENMLTLEVLPWAIRRVGNLVRGTHSRPSVFIEDDRLWVQIGLLHDEWKMHDRGSRLGDLSSFKAQMRAISPGDGRSVKVGSQVLRYRALPADITRRVLDRADVVAAPTATPTATMLLPLTEGKRHPRGKRHE